MPVIPNSSTFWVTRVLELKLRLILGHLLFSNDDLNDMLLSFLEPKLTL